LARVIDRTFVVIVASAAVGVGDGNALAGLGVACAGVARIGQTRAILRRAAADAVDALVGQRADIAVVARCSIALRVSKASGLHIAGGVVALIGEARAVLGLAAHAVSTVRAVSRRRARVGGARCALRLLVPEAADLVAAHADEARSVERRAVPGRRETFARVALSIAGAEALPYAALRSVCVRNELALLCLRIADPFFTRAFAFEEIAAVRWIALAEPVAADARSAAEIILLTGIAVRDHVVG